MNRLSKATMLPLLLVGLSACISTGNSSYQPARAPAEITYAPAIDVAYAEVVDNIPEHLGTNVRWGGQVIESEQLHTVRRLTVMAYPLDKRGKPELKDYANFDGGRFVIDIANEMAGADEFVNRLVTVYGPVSGELQLINGKRQKTIPIVAAVEATQWADRHSRRYHDRRGYAYYRLGLGYGHYGGHRYGYYPAPYYGLHFSYYPRHFHHRHHIRRHHYRHH